MQRSQSRLFINDEILSAGTVLGPTFQGIVADRDSVLVFADDHPKANFEHPCRYLLFDPVTGDLLRTCPAGFPPNVHGTPLLYRVFLEPGTLSAPMPPTTAAFVQSAAAPKGKRFAILFSGMTDVRHLNNLEFSYRLLTSVRYGFDPHNITVLNYNGYRTTAEWPIGTEDPPQRWPGNNTTYKLPVHGSGSRIGMRDALRNLAKRIGPDDLLLIHTTGHGGNWGSGVFLSSAFAMEEKYMAAAFANDLSTLLPRFKHLVVVMEQCFSGAFEAPILGCTCADHISFAAAAHAGAQSHATDDEQWSQFGREWFAAQNWEYPEQSALLAPADSRPEDQVISAEEAFVYAEHSGNPQDTPIYGSTSAAADRITLE